MHISSPRLISLSVLGEIANSLEKKLLLKIRSVPIKANTKLLKNSYGFCFSFAMSFYD
ncbi:hypothetical protein M089_0671 [Bacteroides ovatus str. 3725 D9 iii]|uniref:Uncharacterized protein n=2 Tax=Bacteroides TaxID=816 RepID=A0AAN3A3W6_BACO1|nr:hypothetical protein BACOVA_05532 [Bacteroides ovatus ATCC 8483]EEO54143.1 hypothetical protein BSCG_01069 [Bacteroides sp. 2_2_4]KDS15583.1 hypothetical protein M088_1223 [Bacteroides ovatus str. 3725 D1 iv]KDS46451.1 hypothetical protein M089_0671 [Bacteroides ovatus str. 3725 D9 iii]KXT51137.1 hypothetical protein HMPREF2532_00741 [Bacteroides ovatus]CDM03130.1 hypothetical protein BN890_6820 [Bacteroides xylanisolvens SD CC 1b]